MSTMYKTKYVWGVVLWTLLTTSTSAANVSIFRGPDCTNLGGVWVNAQVGSNRIGSCELPSGFTISGSDRLELGPSVDLVVSNGRRLTIDGSISLLGSSAMYAKSRGAIWVNGTMSMERHSLLALQQGWLENRGVIESEGTIENGKGSGTTTTWGIFNAGHIQLFGGGLILNEGEYADVAPAGVVPPRSLLVDRDGRFINKPGGRMHARDALIHGEFLNESGAEMRSRQHIEVSSEGRLENRGHIVMWDNENGRLVIQDGGVLDSTFGSHITNMGATITIGGLLRQTSATFYNATGGTVETYLGGLLHVLGRSYLVNNLGAAINNMGTVKVHCFATFTNNGTVSGNLIGTPQCFDPPIKPPLAIDWN